MIRRWLIFGLCVSVIATVLWLGLRDYFRSDCLEPGEYPDTATVSGYLPDSLPEASGMAVSQVTPGLIWLHNDSGSGPVLIGIFPETGQSVRLAIPTRLAVDWEAMAIHDAQIYIADTGDNWGIRPTKVIHRLPEPAVTSDSLQGTHLDTLRFKYPDGRPDTEAMLVLPTGDILLITKKTGDLYILDATGFDSASVQIAQRVGTLAYTPGDAAGYIVDAAWSDQHVVIRTYQSLLQWPGPLRIPVLQALAPKLYKYTRDARGEAIALTPDGVYTTSERCGSTRTPLYYMRF